MSASDDHLSNHKAMTSRQDAWSPEAREAAAAARKKGSSGGTSKPSSSAAPSGMKTVVVPRPQHTEASRGSPKTWYDK